MSGVAHPSAGVTRFDRMPAAWKETTEAVAAGAAIDKASEAAIAVGAAWIQETRDLGLQLTDLLHQPVPVKLNRAERDDPVAFMSRVLDELCGEQALAIEYVIPDGVSNLAVRADLRSKSLASSMRIGAPEDRKTARAREGAGRRHAADELRGSRDVRHAGLGASELRAQDREGDGVSRREGHGALHRA